MNRLCFRLLFFSQSGNMQDFFLTVLKLYLLRRYIWGYKSAWNEVFLCNEEQNSDHSLSLFLLVVLASSERRLQLVFYHLLASLLTCCRSPPPPWAPRPQQKASLICSWEQPLTPVWLLGSGGVAGRRGGALKKKKNVCQRRAGCLLDVTMQLQKAHTGIIFTLLHYFPRAPPGERERGRESIL